MTVGPKINHAKVGRQAERKHLLLLGCVGAPEGANRQRSRQKISRSALTESACIDDDDCSLRLVSGLRPL